MAFRMLVFPEPEGPAKTLVFPIRLFLQLINRSPIFSPDRGVKNRGTRSFDNVGSNSLELFRIADKVDLVQQRSKYQLTLFFSDDKKTIQHPQGEVQAPGQLKNTKTA